MRTLSTEFSARKAVAYSGYRGADRNTIPSTADILQDLQLLVQGHFGLIRLFDSSDEHARKVLQVIRDNKLDLKVQLGVWIDGPKADKDTLNKAEVERGVALANEFKDIVLGVSVGNETMVDWSYLKVPAADMVSYITAVRGRITQPVTTDDNWAFFANNENKYQTDSVLASLDYIAMHTYPIADSKYALYDWKQEGTAVEQRAVAMMDASLAKAVKDYTAVASYVAVKRPGLPILIGETGWKSRSTDGEVQRAHPVNQKMYYDRLANWKNGPKAIFYFEAFDEPWKGGDDGWGLFDVQRKAKYVVYDLYTQAQRETDSYSATDAVYYVPSVSGGPVTANVYSLFVDSPASGSATPGGAIPPSWNPWEGTAAGTILTNDVSEGTQSIKVVPNPLVWGWGFFLGLGTPEDLSNFNVANGRLNLSIKTTYTGKLEIGFYTGSTADNNGVDVYLPISSGQYGFANDGAWHNVSIPISAIAAKAAPAYGQPGSATLNMAKVTQGFVVADRYGITGNTFATAAEAKAEILIDNIYWSK